jgi:hypothetical protein
VIGDLDGDADADLAVANLAGDNVSIPLNQCASGPPCMADLDGDGRLTLFDLLVFQNLFDLGSPLAGFDGDGSLTIFDFLAFQNAFDAGCP